MLKSIKKYFESFYYLTYFYGKVRSYVQPYWSTEFKIHEIVPNLYIGDISSAYNCEELEKLGITHVVTAILGVNPIFPNKFIYKNIPIRDVVDEDINNYFQQSNKFIHNAIANGGKVFVHCIFGASRSATLLSAYLMQEYGMTCQDAIERLKAKREVVNPNAGFVEQLETFAIKLQEERIELFMQQLQGYDMKTGKIKKRRHSI